mmetsp:Transcript_18673/g.59315  ORF Transcript_18673/g.59315 Transcript_18673/m.59315 type:complete len:264 (-) Transcript_18673:22-813(-)
MWRARHGACKRLALRDGPREAEVAQQHPRTARGGAAGPAGPGPSTRGAPAQRRTDTPAGRRSGLLATAQEDVRRLQIAMQDSLAVEDVEALQDGHRVKPDLTLGEALLRPGFSDVPGQVASVAVLHQNVKLAPRLLCRGRCQDGFEVSHEVRRLESLQDLHFPQRLPPLGCVPLVAACQRWQGDGLHREELAVGLAAHQPHCAVRAPPQLADLFKPVQRARGSAPSSVGGRRRGCCPLARPRHADKRRIASEPGHAARHAAAR